MGIRSLLRNAFGRSKATREETGAAPTGAGTPESATIPEAREESAPGAAAPAVEAEVPAARTAPAETPEPDPAPTTPTLPAQGSPVDAAPARTPAPDKKAQAPEAAAEPEAAAPEASEDVSTLVSQAFDNPSPAPATEEATAEEVETPEEPKATEKAVEPEPEPQPEPAAPVAAEPEPAAKVEPAPELAVKEEPTAAAPALSLTKVEAAAPGLVSLYKSAGATLEKHGLGAQRAAVYLVLDRSGSMRNYYKDGTVQHLAEQALGLSAHLDDDGTVPVVFFSTDVDGTADLDLANYAGRIEELHGGLGHMGRTNYHWAIKAVIDHYKKSGSTAPAFVIFQTDGAPTSKPAAEKALCEAAGLPIFWQFIGFGDPDAKGFDFLRKLDDLAVPDKRVVDNAGFFHAGRDPRSLSADSLYQQLMVEFPEWLAEARTAGVLKDS